MAGVDTRRAYPACIPGVDTRHPHLDYPLNSDRGQRDNHARHARPPRTPGVSPRPIQKSPKQRKFLLRGFDVSSRVRVQPRNPCGMPLG